MFTFTKLLLLLFSFLNTKINISYHNTGCLGMSDMTMKWVGFTQNVTNPGLFQIRFQDILAHRFEKNPGFVPFDANLTDFGAKPDITDCIEVGLWL